MNTTVPWSIRDVSDDTREAAQEAARRSGQSLGDWLDGVIAEQAAKRKDPRNDHRAEMEAIAAQLARFATETQPETTRDLSRPSERFLGDSVRSSAKAEAPEFDPKAAIRNAVADIARRQADLDRADGPRASPLPQRDGFRGDLMGGTTLIDRPGSRAATASRETASGVAGDLRERSGPRRDVASLSSEVTQTFARFTRDLQDAIHAADVRPQVDDIDKQLRRMGRTMDGLSAGLPTGDAIARISEQTREVRDLLTSAAERSPSLTAVEGQVAKLEARLGALASTPQTLTPELAGTLAEVRALLDSFKPGAALSSLEQRIGDLTRRIERGVEAGTSTQLIEGLSRRVDEIHTSLRSQLADAAVDTRPLEGLVRGIAERIGQAREASSDFQHLEAAMREMAARIDNAPPHLDRGGVQAIEAQITRLADRLDRSESSLKALDGVEHSLGELFSQFEVTRQVAIDAAETAARTAARDTLRAALQSPSLAQRVPEVTTGLADQMTRSIDDLRALQDQSDRRNQSMLADIHQTMDRLARHISTLAVAPPSGVAEARPLSPGNAATDAMGRRLEPSAEQAAALKAEEASARLNRARLSETRIAEGHAAEARAAEARAAEARAAEERAARVELDPADMLIEPGSGRAQPYGRAEPRFDRTSDGAEPQDPALTRLSSPAGLGEAEGPASFIAAARRAARAAQASAATQASAKAVDRRPSPETRPAGTSTLARAKAFLAQRRRPILLSVAALVLLVGALEVVKLSIDEPAGRAGSLETTMPDAGRSPLASRLDGVSRSAQDATSGASATGQGTAVASAAPTTPAAQPPSRPPLPTFVGGLTRPQTAPVEASGLGENLRSLAASGDAAAQYEAGLRFSDGRDVTRDPKQAVAYFEKAAAQGLAPAEYRLGSAYEKGVGVDRDPSLAMAWYNKAADAGDIRAMHNLAVMAAEGAAGKPDYAKAANWFQKASAFGVRDSQFNLAILYARGLGLEQSLAQSYTWFAVAAAEGDEDAGKKRDEVGQKLDAKVLASAKAVADAFRAAIPAAAANEVAPPPGGWDAAPPHGPAVPSGGSQPGAVPSGGTAKVSRL